MNNHSYHINKISYKQIPILFKAMKATDSFVIYSGYYRLQTCSLLMMLSLVGLKKGFDIAYTSTDNAHTYIIELLDSIV